MHPAIEALLDQIRSIERLLRVAPLVMLLAMSASAQDVRVQAALSDSRVLVGDSVLYQIVVEGTQDVTPPAIAAPEGLNIAYAGAAHQPAPVYIVNGRRQDTGPDKYILTYRVTAARAGQFTIPEQSIRVAGRDFDLPAQRLVASDPPEDSASILEVSLSSDTAYVGEPITLTLSWLFASEARSVSFSTLAPDPRPFDILPAVDPRPPSARPNDPRFPVLQLDSQDVVCTMSRTIRGGREYAVVTLTRTIVPTSPGRLEVGPFAATAQVRVGERQIGILLTEDVMERRITRGRAVPLEVRPLPTQGRPPGFSGLVGRFAIEAQASPTQASVGDPIELAVRILGPEPLERVAAPDLASQPGITGAFRLSPDGLRLAPAQAPGARSFTTTIRATSDRVEQIPPIELSYFDTATGQYAVARSTPIPLTIRPTREVTAADAIGAGSAPAPSVAAPTLLPAAPGLLANSASPDVLTNEAFEASTLLTSPAAASALALPPLAFVATGVYVLARRTAPSPAARRREAYRRGVRLLRSRRPDAVAAALRAYVATLGDIPEHAVTSYDARRLVADPSPEGGALADLLDQADAARVHGTSAPDRHAALEALRRAHREAGR